MEVGMRTRTESIARVAALLAGVVVMMSGGCRHTEPGQTEGDGPEEAHVVYFREAPLGEMAEQALPRYRDMEPGDSDLIDPAFDGAPPPIPHTVEDMYPIGIGDNECVECHHPENVASELDRPIPESHFQSPVMAAGAPGEAMASKVSGYRKGEDVAGARYNCSMCHAPQALNVSTPRNLLGRE